jgi:hypothetical protein
MKYAMKTNLQHLIGYSLAEVKEDSATIEIDSGRLHWAFLEQSSALLRILMLSCIYSADSDKFQ